MAQSLKDKHALEQGELSQASGLGRLERLYSWTYSRPGIVRLLDLFGYFAVAATVLAYFSSLALIIFLKKDLVLAIEFIAVTAVPFFAVSVFRHIFNAPRPYELYDFSRFTDRIPKNKKGHSFPSRHIFSSFAIGSTLSFIYLPLGVFVLILGIMLGVWRIFRGIHFPRDVVAGALIGGISGSFGMLLAILF